MVDCPNLKVGNSVNTHLRQIEALTNTELITWSMQVFAAVNTLDDTNNS